VRNRTKIQATVALARITLDLRKQGGLAKHLWSFIGGKPIQNARKSIHDTSRRPMFRQRRASHADPSAAQGPKVRRLFAGGGSQERTRL
jgi:3-methyladenine DNA glycosylase Tag